MLWFSYSAFLFETTIQTQQLLLDSQVYKKFETTEIYSFSFVSFTLSSPKDK